MKTQTELALAERGLTKEASAVSPEEAKKKLLDFVIGSTIAGTGYAAISALKQKIHESNVKHHIIELGNSFKSDPMFSENAAKAKARLYEIARVAPHVTLNTELTKSIIKSKLHNGLTDEDKQNLVMIQSQYYADPKVSGFMPKIASADIGEIMADVVLIKEASFKENAKAFAAFSALPIAAGIIGGAINLGASFVKQRSLKKGLEESFMKALSVSDVDKEPLMQNKERAREAFATLARFAPQVALDPQAARSFMNKIVSYDQGIDTSTVKELSEITKNLSYNKPPESFGEGFHGTSAFVGSPKIVASAFQRANANINTKPVAPV